MLLTLDFETYWDAKFSLSKLPTVQYVRDPRFSIHGCAVKVDDAPAQWLEGSRLTNFFNTVPWNAVTCVAHNALFDGLMLWEHFGHAPAHWSDTTALIRTLAGPNVPVSLGEAAPLMGLGAKGKDLIVSKGLRHLIQPLRDKIAAYACQDAELAYGIHTELYPHLPDTLRKLMTIVTRWGTRALLSTDRDMLQIALTEAEAEQEATILASELTPTQLRSTKDFPAHIVSLGIEVPMKRNTKGKLTPAFAKNDIEFQDLQAEYPEHRALWDARLAATSTGPANRLKTMLEITDHTNTLPMPLLIYGAHTGRKSGTGGYNVQNFQRGSTARKAITAPEGHVICVADSSQIELRMNMWFCGQDDMIELLADPTQDIYSHTASKHFGFAVDKNQHKSERQFGKVIELALGYYMGWAKFQRTAAVGFMGAPPIKLTDLEAQRVVADYRASKKAVRAMWQRLGEWIGLMTSPTCHEEWKSVSFRYREVLLPNGLSLQYPGLQCSPDGQFIYETTKGWRTLHGGKLLENIIQALANIVIDEETVTIDAHPFIQTVSSTHDEILGVAPEERAEQCLGFMLKVMSTPPTWAPDLPVFAEGGYARNYSK